ncbi:unnamed protein product [Tetraodon nigroviridis]|uniref:(spotted green pufferfish) hypothetical protein n=1 Tax=Tetraodon nigroviridis TaxID=99883 RepID=Q4S2R4_TETNG|nr:unnamed protein product [Tetraodon nigroviridis]
MGPGKREVGRGDIMKHVLSEFSQIPIRTTCPSFYDVYDVFPTLSSCCCLANPFPT